MARDGGRAEELDQEKYDADDNVKIICLGDSAVGKSKYVGKQGPDWGCWALAPRSMLSPGNERAVGVSLALSLARCGGEPPYC